MKALIIDDEVDCVGVLDKLLTKYCPSIQIVGMTSIAEEGILLANKHKPDLLFLDIEMPVKNGFQVLDELENVPNHLVFTTAYDRYAVQAIKYAAMDYLLKPIDAAELQQAVGKALQKQEIDLRQLDLLRKQLYAPQRNTSDRIALPYQHGYTFIDVSSIIFCEADNNYTKIYLTTGEMYLITKTLGDVEEVLDKDTFFRTHRQYLININHIKRYIKGDGSILVMTNDGNVPIARNRKDEFNLLFTKL
jgi:two-component system, LytTR family, response regulator